MTVITQSKRNLLDKIEIGLKDLFARSIYKRMLQQSPDPLELNIFKGSNVKMEEKSSKQPFSIEMIALTHQKIEDKKDINDDMPLMLFI